MSYHDTFLLQAQHYNHNKIIKIYNSSLYTVCSLRIEMVEARYEKERNVVPIGASNKFNFKYFKKELLPNVSFIGLCDNPFRGR